MKAKNMINARAINSYLPWLISVRRPPVSPSPRSNPPRMCSNTPKTATHRLNVNALYKVGKTKGLFSSLRPKPKIFPIMTIFAKTNASIRAIP